MKFSGKGEKGFVDEGTTILIEKKKKKNIKEYSRFLKERRRGRVYVETRSSASKRNTATAGKRIFKFLAGM